MLDIAYYVHILYYFLYARRYKRYSVQRIYTALHFCHRLVVLSLLASCQLNTTTATAAAATDESVETLLLQKQQLMMLLLLLLLQLLLLSVCKLLSCSSE
jgi:hypothetical protein